MTTIEIDLPDDVAQRARRAGLLSDSAIRQIAGDLLLCTSPALVEELRGVLRRPHLAARLEGRRSSVEQAARISRDPDDDAVLALAVAAHADFIVSGDSDLLVLGRTAGIPIVTAAQAVAILAS